MHERNRETKDNFIKCILKLNKSTLWVSFPIENSRKKNSFFRSFQQKLVQNIIC